MARRAARDRGISVPLRETADGYILQVRVQPRSSRKGIEGVEGGVLKVKLTAPPVEGEANAQLLEVLAEELGVRKSSIEILKGQSARLKTLKLSEAPKGRP